MTGLKRIRPSSGFTLIEVLLVLALVGLMASLVAGNAGALISGGDFEPPVRVLRKAVLDASYSAVERKRPSFLSYDETNATFLVLDEMGRELSRHQIFKSLDGQEVPEIQFHATGPLSGPDGGSTAYRDDDLELSRVHFHAGSSVPFRAEMEFREESQTIYFDPFSGFALKEEE